MNSEVHAAEAAIDALFGNNELKNVGYPQAMWTLLSAAEDMHLAASQGEIIGDELFPAFIDNLLNTITHPLRVCYTESSRIPKAINHSFIEKHYALASDWINLANSYRSFCSVFPMWRKKKIDIHFYEPTKFNATWSPRDPEYEAYNRFVEKDGKTLDPIIIGNELLDVIDRYISVKGRQFKLHFTPILVRELIKFFEPVISQRFSLPENWKTTKFSFGEFKKIFSILFSLTSGWYWARVLVAQRGIAVAAYPSSVLVIRKYELVLILKKYTNYAEDLIQSILEMLTFGRAGIRNPDITTQPIVDLDNGFYAMAPLVWRYTNAERNLCVLLNQIDTEKKIYSALTKEKEGLFRNEIKTFLEPLGYEIRYGKVAETDIDVSIIDRKNKTCICIELKWFIEPAEIREVVERSEELEKGVQQAQKINALFATEDRHLMNEVLQIDRSYTFLTIIGSRNWVGNFDVQNENVPIIKVWHLLEKIKELGSLQHAVNWLIKRQYLPVREIDFTVQDHEIKCGNWQTRWYGIVPITRS